MTYLHTKSNLLQVVCATNNSTAPFRSRSPFRARRNENKTFRYSSQHLIPYVRQRQHIFLRTFLKQDEQIWWANLNIVPQSSHVS